MPVELFLFSLMGRLTTLLGSSMRGPLEAAWGMQAELERLKAHLAGIQSTLAASAEKETVDGAVTLLAALKQVAYEADNVLDEFDYDALWRKAEMAESKVPRDKVRHFFSSRNPIFFRLHMGRKLSDIIKRLENIESECRRLFRLIDSAAQPKTKVEEKEETWSFIRESDVVGRHEEKEQIVTMLISSNNHYRNGHENLAVLPIVAMEGVGKTTVAQLIYNDPRIKNHFDVRVWVHVSDAWDNKKIIGEIVNLAAGKKLEWPTEEEAHLELRKALAGKRYLMVLDDVWNENGAKWNRLKSMLDSGVVEGSAIVVTTCNERVSKIMETIPSYHLSFLSENESLSLFSRIAFAHGAEESEELSEIGAAIARKCEGLPLALVMLGNMLYKESDRRQWLKIMESNIWSMRTGVLPALWLCYKQLPSESKQCLAFCAIFPKNHVIEKERLIEMWMAHGFIPSSDGGLLEFKGHEIFNKLVQRSFFHDLKQERVSAKTRCTMHNLVHDLAVFVAGNECVASSKGSPKVATPKDVYHLSILKFDTLKGFVSDVKNMLKAFANLRTLLLSDYFTTLKRMNVSRMTSLRVLKFQNIGATLPLSAKYLKHLRYLDLSFTEISDLPESICELLHLQTLDLSRCYRLCNLPERMQCMISLRHLYLDGCYKLRKMPPGMGQLPNLQILTMFIVGDEAGRGLGELNKMQLSFRLELYNLRYAKDVVEAREVNLDSKDLQSLALCWREAGDCSMADDRVPNEENRSERVLKELRPPFGLKILKIWHYDGLNYPGWMSNHLQHLVELHLGCCRRLRQLPEIWRLNSLEVLSLKRLDDLVYIVSGNVGDATGGVFPALRKLKLSHLGSLRDWSVARLHGERICFPALVFLKIKKCPRLDSVPLLPRLQILRLVESSFPPDAIHALTTLVYVETRSDQETRGFFLPHDSYYHVSQHLYLSSNSFARLSSISFDRLRSSTSIRTLLISDCSTIFPILCDYKSLISLTLSDCPNLTGESFTTKVCLPPQLEWLKFENCEKLATMPSFPASLRSLEVSDCPALSTLAAPREESLGHLVHLEYLTIQQCSSLKSLAPGKEGLTALRRMKIVGCSDLTWLPEVLLRRLPDLEQLTIKGCPELEKKCIRRGEYSHLLSNIPNREIGIEEDERTRVQSLSTVVADFLNLLS